MDARAGVQDGAEQKALLNFTPFSAMASMFGVFTTGSP
jgi:hypothetical protein